MIYHSSFEPIEVPRNPVPELSAKAQAILARLVAGSGKSEADIVGMALRLLDQGMDYDVDGPGGDSVAIFAWKPAGNLWATSCELPDLGVELRFECAHAPCGSRGWGGAVTIYRDAKEVWSHFYYDDSRRNVRFRPNPRRPVLKSRSQLTKILVKAADERLKTMRALKAMTESSNLAKTAQREEARA